MTQSAVAVEFQSTRPLRGGTSPIKQHHYMSRFQPPRPLRGGTASLSSMSRILLFQSTRPLRGGTRPRSLIPPPRPFQSTRPLRGGTAILHKKTVQNIAYCTKSAFTLAVLSGFLALMRPFFLPNVHKFRCEPSEESLLAPRSHAYTIRTPLRLIAGIDAEVFHLGFIAIAQIIKPQAVLLLVHQGTELMLKLPALRSIQYALEHGILDALPIVHALLCNQAEPPPSCRILCVHIIRDQNQHRLTSRETADRHPDRGADTAPAPGPAYRGPVPMGAFLPDKDALSSPVCAPASFSGIFDGPYPS